MFGNEHLSSIIVDKTKDLQIMYLAQYTKKLSDFFSDETKFESLSTDPLDKNIIECRKLITSMKPYLNNINFRKISALERTKVGYGLIKRHKTGMPIRPIISSIGSLTCGIEEYLLKLLKPLEQECTYSINSTKMFKEKFLKSRNKFNNLTHQILSFDAIQLYTRVNVDKVVNYVVDKIYKNKQKFFKEGNKILIENRNKRGKGKGTEKKIPYPPKAIFKKFLTDTLLKYNCFNTLSGFYRQKSGLSMGSKLSPLLSNIYCNLMEQEIIKKHQQNGNIIAYHRYVDDIYLIILKGSKNEIIQDMNNYDPLFLNFTLEEIENNKLVFLDTSIFIDNNGVPQLRMYRKLTNSDVKINFKSSIMSKKHKISSLCGDIFRCFYTTVTPDELDKALINMKNLYLKNQYPVKLIDSKIFEIRNRNFTSKSNKLERTEEIQKFPNRNFNLCLPFTALRCEKISYKIVKLVKKYTPDYRLNICWKSEKLGRFYTPKLKLPIPKFEKTGAVYNFKCRCEKTFYIGETQRRLKSRIKEHNQPSCDSAISDHIYSCDIYLNLLKETFGDKPSPTEKQNYIKDCFTSLATNLYSYHYRKDFEAMAISLLKPPLNEQVQHRSVRII